MSALTAFVDFMGSPKAFERILGMGIVASMVDKVKGR